VIQKSFDKRKQLICDQVLVSKEDRELVTKSEIVVLIKLFKLLNLVLKIMQDQGEDAELKVWLRSCL
jgi:hydroxymethylpyrimidine/phosphomethylpyrimidine kinase